MMTDSNLVLVAGAVAAIFIVFFSVVLASRYRKVGPDEALVITGGKRGIRVVRGGGTFVFPIIEIAQRLPLKAFTLRARASAFHSTLGAPALLETTAMVRIEPTQEAILKAAEQFLGAPEEQMAKVATEVIEQHMRQVLGTMEAEAIFRDIEKLGERLEEQVVPDLAKLGLTAVTFTLGVGKVSPTED
jgi:flotillin